MLLSKVGLCSLLLIAGSASLSLAASTTYHVTDLGVLPGGSQYNQSTGAAINAAGQIVGTSDKPYGGYANGTEDGFLYSGGKLTDLGTLLGNFGSFATGINNSGQAVANAFNGGYFGYTAFVYANGRRTALPALGTGTATYGRGINDVGQVTGESAIYQGDVYDYHAFLYTNGVTKDLGVLGLGDSIGYAVNHSGQVCGYSNVGFNNAVHAFLYTGGRMIDLGTLGGASGNSDAYGVNDAGQIVGQSSIKGDNYAFRGFVYTGGRMYDLNSLLDASSKTYLITNATGINTTGAIVGGARRSPV